MPEGVVWRRLSDWKFRLKRWFYRKRPQIAVLAAFAVACLIGLAAASLGMGAGSAEADAPAPATP